MKWQPITMLHQCKNNDICKLKGFANQFGFNQCDRYHRPYRLRMLLAGYSYKEYNNANLQHDTPNFEHDWLDHGQVFKVKGTTRVVLVGQNYEMPDNEEQSHQNLKMNLIEIITPLDLVAVIFNNSKSYYYPGGTCLHMIMTPETYHYYEDTILSDPALICVM
ncbi:hypothetical protein [Secundilactobacillus muriivasis]